MIPYSRPAFAALKTRVESDLAALPAALRGPMSAMWARMVNGMHGHLDWINLQNSPLTCELERLYDWAALYEVDRLVASKAAGAALAGGVAGTQLLADTVLRGQNGLDYVVLAAVVLGAGETAVSIRCAAAGSAGNLSAGQTLTLVDPVPGCNGTLTVGAGSITGGAEDESVNAWRARVVEEWAAVVSRGGRSGKIEDYRFWARSAHQSVTGSLVQLHTLGTGTVLVRPVCNGLADRMPTQAVLDAVAARYAAIAPAAADWRVAAPAPHPVSLNIHLLPGVDTAENRAAIQSALNALMLTKGNGSDGALQLLWAEVDAVIAVITTQYTLDESGVIAWLAHEVPVLQPVNWI